MSETAVSERPTMAQAFAADIAPATESPTVTPSTESTAPAPASADATVPPDAQAQTTTPASTDAGPIPLERHKAILDAVYKERDDARSQLDGWKAYDWAKQIPKDQFDAMQHWYQQAQTNPADFVIGRLEELAAHPQYAPAIRSQAARLLRAARGTAAEPAPAAPDLTPDIPVYDGQGQLVNQTFSAQKVQQIVQQAVQAAMAEHVQPIKQDLETRKQTEQKAEADRQTQAYVASESARIRSAVQKLPEATKHWDAIVEKAKTYPDTVPVGEALRDAYLDVVLPTLTQSAKTEVLDTLKTKAAASSVNPSAAVTTTGKRPTSLLDKSLTW